MFVLESVDQRSTLSQRPYFQHLNTMGSDHRLTATACMHFYHHHLNFSIGCRIKIEADDYAVF